MKSLLRALLRRAKPDPATCPHPDLQVARTPRPKASERYRCKRCGMDETYTFPYLEEGWT